MKYHLLLCSFISLSLISFQEATAQKQKEVIQEPELSKELISMFETDQKLRINWAGRVKKGKTGSKKFKALSKKLLETDRNNTVRMKEIIATHGWPTIDLVGRRGSNSAWLLVQHADRNPIFQKECLPLLKEAVDNGQAKPSNYAYLYDRVQVAYGEKQLYATQSSTNNGIKEGSYQPIEDESNVQKRREEMGIDLHIEEYAARLGFSYKVPTEKEAVERAVQFEANYRLNADKARKAMESNDFETAAEYFQLAVEANGSIETEIYVETARAISLAKSKDCSWAFFYLMKAAIRGYEDIDQFNTSDDFKIIREASPENWKDLMGVIDEINRGGSAQR